MSKLSDLVLLFKQANDAYYNYDKPILTDDEFDKLREKIEQLDPTNPVLQTVGAVVVNEKTEKLPFFMGSFDKIMPKDKKFLEKWNSNFPGLTYHSYKVDGVSSILTKTKLFTRGNGIDGGVITHLIPYVQHGALQSLVNLIPDDVILRGELVFTTDDFNFLAKKQGFSSSRAAVIGTIISKTLDENWREAVSRMRFIPYTYMTTDGKGYTIVEQVQLISNLLKKDKNKILMPPGMIVKNTTIELLKEELKEARRVTPYAIDGYVVIHAEKAYPPLPIPAPGESQPRAPKYAFAFKMEDETMEESTVVTKIEWITSMRGLLKPTIHYEPVEIDGSFCQNATGKNAQFIRDEKVGPGARVVIGLNIVPNVIRVITPSNLPFSKYQPENPSTWQWGESGKDIELISTENNENFQAKRLEHFAAALNAAGFGPSTCKRMVEAGYNTPEKILLENNFEKAAENIGQMTAIGFEKLKTSLYNSIQKASLPDFMNATLIFQRGLGREKFILALEHIDLKMKPSQIEIILTNVNGFGVLSAERFASKINEFNEYYNLIHKIVPKIEIKKEIKNKISLNVVFSGFRDKELESKINNLGGKVQNGITKTTNYLVVADLDQETGKTKEASEKNIPIITKDKLKQIIE